MGGGGWEQQQDMPMGGSSNRTCPSPSPGLRPLGSGNLGEKERFVYPVTLTMKHHLQNSNCLACCAALLMCTSLRRIPGEKNSAVNGFSNGKLQREGGWLAVGEERPTHSV